MAVTGAIFHSLTFGGVNSADYGIYITGEAVYNAPVRNVELIDVPGRNGQVALDKGSYGNIEVKYPAGTFGDDQTDFAEAISAFRNAVLSQVGYQRLTDTYHPSEYRMALYVNGLEADTVNNGSAGEFDLVFNCKPQRWLVSGETAVTVADGDTLTNPTLFDASPLLEVEGHGTIGFNGYEIELDQYDLGQLTLFNGETFSTVSRNKQFSEALLNAGDTIFAGAITLDWNVRTSSGGTYSNYSVTATGEGTATTTGIKSVADAYVSGTTTVSGITFTAGTYETKSFNVNVAVTFPSYGTETMVFTVDIAYTSGMFVLSLSVAMTAHTQKQSTSCSFSEFTAYSTVSMLGHPTYVDCDLGEAYKYVDGELVSLNAYIDLGSDLPTFAPGTNTITIDSTITELKVTPRWWKI